MFYICIINNEVNSSKILQVHVFYLLYLFYLIFTLCSFEVKINNKFSLQIFIDILNFCLTLMRIW